MEWIAQNAGTIFVVLILAALVFLAVRSMWKEHRSGKCSGCAGCDSGKGKCACNIDIDITIPKKTSGE